MGASAKPRTVSVVKEMKKVDSELVASMGYNPEKKVMEVEFHENRVYAYQDVPEKVYKDMIGAKSIGKYFLKNVLDKYDFEKIV